LVVAVKRDSQAVVLLLVGGVIVKLTLSGDLLFFVNPWMRWPLLLSGSLLAALALVHFASDWKQLAATSRDDVPTEPRDADDHDAPPVAWLLLAPVLVVFLVAPPALGSFAAERRLRDVPEPAQYVAMRPLRGPDPVRVTIQDFLVRSEYDPGLSLAERELELIGFVTVSKGGDWFLTRFTMGCCAADASAYRLRVVGAPAPPAEDWVRLTGTWDAEQPKRPTLVASTVERIEPPKRPYE
jgi:uncharacterized repeat protein (TIGR03943 family)